MQELYQCFHASVARMTFLIHCLWFFLILGYPLQAAQDGKDAHSKQRNGNKSFLGYRLVDGARSILEVNADYYMQIFYKSAELTEIRVVPKYMYAVGPGIAFRNKEVLTKDEYSQLLRKIQCARSLGKMLMPGKIGVTSNNISIFLDRYEYGVVYYKSTTIIDDDGSQEKGYVGFRVIYYQKVSGMLSQKLLLDVSGMEYEYRIKISDRWYWTTEQEYRKHEVGEHIIIDSAAPIPRTI